MCRKIYRQLYFIIILIALGLCSCTFGGDESKPFEMYAGPSSLLKNRLKEGDSFDVRIYLVVERPVSNVKMQALFPKEVIVKYCYVETYSDRHEGYRDAKYLPINSNNVYLWEQERLSPDRSSFWWEELTWDRPIKGKRMGFHLVTLTDGTKWSAPVKASVEFDYVKAEDETGAMGSVETGHYVAEFVGGSDKWLSQR